MPRFLLGSYALDEGASGLLRIVSTPVTRAGRSDPRITVLALHARSSGRSA